MFLDSFVHRFLDFKQQERDIREIREDEEYERDAGDGSFFSYLTNGCFRKNRNMNKYKYVLDHLEVEVEVEVMVILLFTFVWFVMRSILVRHTHA